MNRRRPSSSRPISRSRRRPRWTTRSTSPRSSTRRSTCCTAYELPVVGFPDGVLLPNAEIASRIVTWAQSELDACVAKRSESSVSITPILRQGDHPREVLSVAEEVVADLIVMGTHGRRGLSRALIGSTTESVVRTSPVPVMTVHAAKA